MLTALKFNLVIRRKHLHVFRMVSFDARLGTLHMTLVSKGGKFLKKLWCCVGGSITR